MDFFEHQDQARKRTRKLVIYFAISVILTILSIYVICAAGLYYASTQITEDSSWQNWLEPFWGGLPFDGNLMFFVFSTTGLIIFLGSSVKTFQLSKGGKAVAIMLGGQRLQPNSESLQEKQLLNIVEEMAIASGTPIPEVYLLPHETSINAFAAGFTPTDAAIGITRGSLELLNRDEIQGVIAHEFSHILNGDMRLNMQMTCLTHGILFIAEAGSMMLRLPLRIAFYSSGSSRREGSMPPQALLVILALGIILMVMGSIGYFFAQLIKSAVSRQREFLADAAAIQFTRNPEGIGMALKKIGGLAAGSQIQASQSEEASHFFFANGLSSSWMHFFATHPTLAQRIAVIDPHFDGTFPKIKSVQLKDESADTTQPAKPRMNPVDILTGGATSVPVAGLVASAGEISPATLQAARALTHSLPEPLYQAAHDPFGARAVVYGLLLSDDPEVLDYQNQLLQQQADPAVLNELKKLLPEYKNIQARHRMVLMDLALPALRQLSPVQYETFRQIVAGLAAADQAISLFEYCMEKALVRHLEPAFTKVELSTPTVHSLIPVWQQCMQLLGALAYLDSQTYEEAEEAFEAGASQLNLADRNAELPPREEAGLVQVDAALNACAGLTPMHKRNLLYACAQVVLKFRGCHDEEAELIRAIADTLDCPLPPFVAEQMA